MDSAAFQLTDKNGGGVRCCKLEGRLNENHDTSNTDVIFVTATTTTTTTTNNNNNNNNNVRRTLDKK
jgi:hypothetical protein